MTIVANNNSQLTLQRISIVLLLFVSLQCTGCACTEDVSVVNTTNKPIRVQLALPWPSYSVASRNGCHFAFTLQSGQRWETEGTNSSDKTRLGLKMANGALLIRLHDVNKQRWHTFAILTGEGVNLRDIDPVSISISRNESSILEIDAVASNGMQLKTRIDSDSMWFE